MLVRALTGSAFGTSQCSVRMRGASCLCVSKTGTIRRDISLTHPTNHIGGRVVSLTHTNVEYFWSSRAAVSGCHAMLVRALTGSAFGTSQCSVRMRGASCLCVSKTGTIRRDISLTHPTNHIGGRVVSLTHTNVEYFWSSRAAVSGCHAMLALALTGSAFGTRQCVWYQPVCMRGASYLCVSKTGTIRRDISLTHPTNHIGGRVVSLTHTNVEYFWSSRAAVSGCHAMLVALTGSAFGTSQCVCVAQAVCACPKLGPSVGTFRSHTQLTTSEVELFRSLTPMSSTFGRVVLLSADAMPC